MSALPLLQGGDAKQSSFATGMYGALFAALFMLAILSVSKFFKRSRRGRIALHTNAVRTSSPRCDQYPINRVAG
jgi:hypothetical protein